MIPRFECKAKAVSRRDDRLMSTCCAGHHQPPLGVVSTLWMMYTSTRLLPQVSKGSDTCLGWSHGASSRRVGQSRKTSWASKEEDEADQSNGMWMPSDSR